jgi:23S rRNA (cytidine1920-2'-O)/16S rRNA (cytidine1409-2'-O)-methyltransferase
MDGSPDRQRADELVFQRGLAPTRSKAKVMILAGEVRSGDRVIDKPGQVLASDIPLEIAERQRYVSRGGLKLEAALDAFDIDVSEVVAADLGASTGGFTDCLLQHGARKVYAVDVGYGQLDYRLRTDRRVTVMERINARYLQSLPEPVDLVVVDVSFISLRHILPVAQRLLSEGGQILALVKPQFEAGKDAVNRRGVVRDDRVREDVVRSIIAFAHDLGLKFRGLVRSPAPGPAGNEEFVAWFALEGEDQDVDDVIAEVFG